MASKSPIQFEEYRSKTMELSRQLIQGVVQKKIEHVEWYHTKHFHEKFIKVDFTTAKILIYK